MEKSVYDLPEEDLFILHKSMIQDMINLIDTGVFTNLTHGELNRFQQSLAKPLSLKKYSDEKETQEVTEGS